MISAEKCRFLIAIRERDREQMRSRLHNEMSIAPLCDALAESIGINGKRAIAWLDAYSGKGWWEYGVSVRGGWLTHKGRVMVDKLIAERWGGWEGGQ